VTLTVAAQHNGSCHQRSEYQNSDQIVDELTKHNVTASSCQLPACPVERYGDARNHDGNAEKAPNQPSRRCTKTFRATYTGRTRFV